MFAFQNAGAGRLTLEGLSTSQLEADNGTSKFDLTLDVFDMGQDGLQAEFEYSSDLFEPATVARMAGQFQRLLAGVVSDPSCTISQLDLVSPEEADTERQWSRGAQSAAFERPVAPRPWRNGRTALRRRRPCAGTAAS